MLSVYRNDCIKYRFSQNLRKRNDFFFRENDMMIASNRFYVCKSVFCFNIVAMALTWFQDKKYSDRERWMCIYPAYINSKKTVAEGRRIPKNQCIENPTCQEIRDVLDSAGFHIGVENKLYPREQNKDNIVFRGRVRVQVRNDDGTAAKPNLQTKKAVLIYLGEMIPKLKSRTQGKGGGEQSQNAASAAKRSRGKKGRK